MADREETSVIDHLTIIAVMIFWTECAFRPSYYCLGAAEMTIEQMRAAYQAQPFRPFVIHLADGREVPVEHPEFIMSAPSGRTLVVARPDDTFHIIDLLLVTDLEIRPIANGPAKRRKA